MEQTAKGNRLYISIFGKRNSGKSTLMNTLCGQQSATVSPHAGTTTDPVYQAIEWKPLGACMLVDTAGYDDVGDLGLKRIAATQKILEKTDVALWVTADGEVEDIDRMWAERFSKRGVPCLLIMNTGLSGEDVSAYESLNVRCLKANAADKSIRALLAEEIAKLLPKTEESGMLGNLIGKGETVMLVMPQDASAPKGRLILPQVQAIRELLDRHCRVIAVATEETESALTLLMRPPDWIIVDSQAFAAIAPIKPTQSKLTSFSILLAMQKGDIEEFVKGANAIDALPPDARILIAEACTHAPLTEDIGRVKIPALLRKRLGAAIRVDVSAGLDFPDDLASYNLIVHCGACMFNRKTVINRIAAANQAGVAVTNYGVLLAKLTGTLGQVDLF